MNSALFLLQEIGLHEEKPPDSRESETDESDGFVKDEVEDSELLEDIADAIKIDGDSRPKPKPVGHLSQ